MITKNFVKICESFNFLYHFMDFFYVRKTFSAIFTKYKEHFKTYISLVLCHFLKETL